MTSEGSQPDRKYRALVWCVAFEPGFRAGGPIQSVARILDTASSAVEVQLVTRDRDLGDAQPYPGLGGRWVGRGRHSVFYLGLGRPKQWWNCIRATRARGADLLYVNSFFSPTFSVIPVLLTAARVIPSHSIMVAPRGELSPGAVSLKARKKNVFLRLWRPVLSAIDVVFHASTELEAGHIRQFFPHATVMINGNQTAHREPVPPTVIQTPAETLRLVFIGRISPMKNLDALLRALGRVREVVTLDIYGPAEDDSYWRHCSRLISDLGANVTVRYKGELQHRDVSRTFAQYDAFVLPTLGENFGHAIAESLAAACPVIAPDTTPWTSVLAGGGGAVLESCTSEALAGEIGKWAALTIAQRSKAKRSAAIVYGDWLRSQKETNILDEARVRTL